MSLPPAPPWVEPAAVEDRPETMPPRSPRRSRWPLILSVLTAVTTLIAGAEISGALLPALELMARGSVLAVAVGIAKIIVGGAPYAMAVGAFFLAHEMGHYVACRVYGVDATPPFFIPSPPLLFMFGTFGAVIRIRSPIPSRRALFDIGIAGPLAGFVVAVALVVVGVLGAEIHPHVAARSGTWYFGDSLLTWLLVKLLRPDAAGMDITAGPVFLAGWLALFATALNLVPAGQLDGGHIVYALTRRWHGVIALAAGSFLAGIVIMRGLVYHELSAWFLWAIIVFVFGRRHPAPLTWDEDLGRGRTVLAVVAAIVMLLCFMPHPISIVP